MLRKLVLLQHPEGWCPFARLKDNFERQVSKFQLSVLQNFHGAIQLVFLSFWRIFADMSIALAKLDLQSKSQGKQLIDY